MEKNINIIDLYIKLSRRVISTCAESFTDFKNDIVCFLEINDKNAYDFIIDSLYLLEDTQLAKKNFLEFGTTGPTKYRDFGETYLRTYGILNACYLQQQAIIEMHDKLKIQLNNKELKNIKEFSLFDLRNIFAAHTVSRGFDSNKHSFILDRHGLLKGKLKGFSLNHKSGNKNIDADISEEIYKWNEILSIYLKNITFKIVKNTDDNPIFKDIIPKYHDVFERIADMSKGDCTYSNVWDESSKKITFL